MIRPPPAHTRYDRVRMRVEANVTSGLLATDSSAVELVPLLQAEVRKLREMLTAQRFPIERERDRDLVESKVVEEMRERVRELEVQLADREKLIDSLDSLRKEQQLEDEELERLFVLSGNDKEKHEDRFNLYRDDVKNNYNSTYSSAYSNNSYSNMDSAEKSESGNFSQYSMGNSVGNNNNYSHINNINTINNGSERDSWDSGKGSKDGNGNINSNSNSAVTLNRSQAFSPSNSPPMRPKSNRGGVVDWSGSSQTQNHSQNQTIKSLLNSRNRTQDHEARHTYHGTHTYHNGSPPSGSREPGSPSYQSTTARSQPVVVLSDDAVDVSHPRVINLNQVRVCVCVRLRVWSACVVLCVWNMLCRTEDFVWPFISCYSL
jgi:hypothetical protein